MQSTVRHSLIQYPQDSPDHRHFSKVYNDRADPDTLPVKWKVCSVSQLLNVFYKGAKNEKIIVRAVPKNLRNILGFETLIDCDQEGGATETDTVKAKQLKMNDGENIAEKRNVSS